MGRFHVVDSEDFPIGNVKYFWLANGSRSKYTSFCLTEKSSQDSVPSSRVFKGVVFKVPVLERALESIREPLSQHYPDHEVQIEEVVGLVSYVLAIPYQ